MNQPGSYRPTTLKLAAKHCPRAVDFYESGEPYDRGVFHAGTAAHAVLQAIGEAASDLERGLEDDEIQGVAIAAGKRLIEQGRSFDGEPEPPLPHDDVWEGVELAIKYARFNPVLPGRHQEVGLAVDSDWNPIPYSKGARLRLIADVIYPGQDGDEEGFYTYVEVHDYKSAWPTNATELNTVQLRAQAVMALLHSKSPVDVLRRTVTNLRTLQTFSEDILVGDSDELAKVELWKKEIKATMEALDQMRSRDGRRPARPGRGCLGCPFFSQCLDAQDYIERHEALATPEEMARGYAVAVAAAAQLKPKLQALTRQRPMTVDDFEIGTFPEEQLTLKEDAYGEIADSFTNWGGEARGLCKALSLGVGNLRAFIKERFRDHPEMGDAFLARVTLPSMRRKFMMRTKEVK